MGTFQDILSNKDLKNKISSFVSLYGTSSLAEALDLYADLQHTYTIKTKTSVFKIRICDINYIEIDGHHMMIHTSDGAYRKYGSLSEELKKLSSYGFRKCSQNCIVSLYKIERISQSEIILKDGARLHLSRGCATQILSDYTRPQYDNK